MREVQVRLPLGDKCPKSRCFDTVLLASTHDTGNFRIKSRKKNTTVF